MDSIWLVTSVVGGSWLLGGIIGGITALGSGIIALPIMLLVLSPQQAIPLTLLIGMVAVLQLFFIYKRFSQFDDIRAMLIGALPGIVLGVMVLKLAPDSVLQTIVAALIICFLLLQFFPTVRHWQLSNSLLSNLIGGGVCGAITASVGIGGVPFSILIIIRHWMPDRARGNAAAFFFYLGLPIMFLQGFAGLYNTNMLLPALAGMVGSIIGQQIGVYIGKGIKPQVFRFYLFGFLAFAAIALLGRVFI